MSRPHARLELRAWVLMAVPMGLLTGGVAGVLVNTIFSGRAVEWLLVPAVAVATGAASLANVFSMLWSHWSRGRDKVRSLARLQALLAACLLLMACVPKSSLGLALLIVAIVAAQALWCGIVTIRGSIWRMNYTREARTVFVARNQMLATACVAAIGAFAGYAVDLDVDAFRALFVAGALFAFASMTQQRRLKVRRGGQLLAAERLAGQGQRFSPATYLSILREDRPYRQYMLCMMVFGSGNLMVTALLILVLTQNLGVSGFTQVLITASLPQLLTPLTTPFWGRLLSRRHIVRFRTVNSRMFVGAMCAYLTGAALGLMPLLWLGAILQGSGVAGGSLGWALGHNDFAPEHRAADYLGLHISLTGVRGLVAPLLGVGLHGLLEAWQPGAGLWALALPLTLTTTGSLGFHVMARHTPTD